MNVRNTVACTAALVCILALLSPIAQAQPQIPLDPSLIPKFAEPLPLPSSLDGTNTSSANPLVIRMSEFQQRILPAALYPPEFSGGTYVWGYNGSFPGPTIEARRGVPTTVHFVNDLQNPSGGLLFLQGTLAVDQTLHWADPLGQHPQMGPYLGPIPACVHLHGGEVPSAFDGGPDAWWTPGRVHEGPGFVTDTYVYPNEQQPMTMFYHDHALGITRLNVYAGLAGFYLVRDPAEEPANLPGGPADSPLDEYGNPYERGIAIQDRMFDTNGQLYFPSDGINPEHPYWLPEFFGDVILVNGRPWPFLSVEPRRYRIRVVNGSNARFYSMRLVDETLGTPGPALWQIGSDGGLLDAPVELNDALVPDSPPLVMAPGERADLIIDFAGYAGRTFTLTNDANTPYPDGDPVEPDARLIMQFRVGNSVTGGMDPSLDPATTTALRPHPIERPTPPPVTRALTLNESIGEGGPLEMFVNNTMWAMTPTENVRVGDTEVWEIINLTMDTHPMHLHLFQFQMLNRQAFDVMGYTAAYGEPEPGMGPPLPYDEQSATTGFKLGGNPDVTPFLQGPAMLPDPNERGWKDTFRMNPGEVTRILVRAAPQDAEARAAAQMPPAVVQPGTNLFEFEPWVGMGQTDRFGYPGGPGYVWHCHIIDHEDNEMMRQLMVLGPLPPVGVLTANLTTVQCDDGIKVIWELTDASTVTALTLERSDAEAGPWTVVEGQAVQEGKTSILVDRTAAADRVYWYRLVARLDSGSKTVLGTVQSETAALMSFSLGQVAPNPTSGPVRIDFSLAKDADIQMTVVDVGGRIVTVLAEARHRAGHYTAVWDCAGPRGRVPAGVYFVRYRAAGHDFTKRVVIAR